MWKLILLAVSLNDPTDVPGTIQLMVPSEPECIELSKSLTYKLKFDGFKVVAQCKQS